MGKVIEDIIFFDLLPSDVHVELLHVVETHSLSVTSFVFGEVLGIQFYTVITQKTCFDLVLADLIQFLEVLKHVHPDLSGLKSLGLNVHELAESELVLDKGLL